MDLRFVANTSEESVAKALKLWPEFAGRRIRPLLVTAFGAIFVETDSGEVLVADPIELTCDQAAESVQELQGLFSDREWSEITLMTELVFLAEERGVARREDQVFAIAPHPCFTGEINVEQLQAMDLHVWHHICSQLRNGPANGAAGA